MMENTEEVFQALEEFSKKKHKVISRELEEYLHFVARTGDPVYQWGLVKQLFKEKLLNVITDFYETSPGIDIPHCRNVEIFNYETMKNSLLEKIDAFAAAPFTIQRICELLTSPRKQYSRIDKFMRAFEKNILVVSTREPGPLRHSDSELDNGDAQESLVNGSDSNSDYNVDVDMEDMSNWKESADPLTYAVHNSEDAETNRGDDYAAHNGPVHREMMSVEGLGASREEEEERGPQPSTSSGDDEKMDEDDEAAGSQGGRGGDSSGEEDGERSGGQEESEDTHKVSSEGEPEEDVDVDRVVEDVSPPPDDKQEDDTDGTTEEEEETAVEQPIVTQVEENKQEVEERAGREDEGDMKENEERAVQEASGVEAISEGEEEDSPVDEDEQKEEPLQLNIEEETLAEKESKACEVEDVGDVEVDKTQEQSVEMEDKEEAVTVAETPAPVDVALETQCDKEPEVEKVEEDSNKSAVEEEAVAKKEEMPVEEIKEEVAVVSVAAVESSDADVAVVPEPDISSSGSDSSVEPEKVDEAVGEVAAPPEATNITSEVPEESS